MKLYFTYLGFFISDRYLGSEMESLSDYFCTCRHYFFIGCDRTHLASSGKQQS